MKQIALILILTLLIPACGTNSSYVQQAASGVWQAQLLAEEGAEPGLGFVVQFTVSGTGGTLSFSSFQFLTSNPCFPVSGNGLAPAGSMSLQVNTTTFQVTGSFDFTVSANGNTLALTGNVTGTENGVTGTQLSNGSVLGSWTLTGTGACASASGSFIMTQSSSS